MRHVKRIPGLTVAVLLVLLGVVSVLTGVYLLTGLAVTLIVGGVLAVAAGLLVDV
ncbi:MAG: hypothetical protein AB7G17_14395 [Phycisphaerales bacterium]